MTFSTRRLEEKRKASHVPWKKLLGLLVLLARPAYVLARKVQRHREEQKHWKRLLTVGIAGVVALSIILLAFSLLVRIGSLSLSSFVGMAGAPLLQDEREFTNFLLLGQGNEDHDGIDLTDTIMVASLDPEHSESIVLLSLPRDLYFLHTEAISLGKGKLNALWRDERIVLQREGKERREASILALQHLAKDIGDALGIPIHYTVKVDFTAFEDIIDALGGIDLEVRETIHDTEYPGPNYTYETFHIDAGPQHLDGATALKYARTRHTSSDFDRSARQQQMLQALTKKAKSSGVLRKPGKLLDLYTILTEHIETDLTTRHIATLASIALELPEDRIVRMQLSDFNGLYDGLIAPGGFLYAPPRELFGGAAELLPVSIPEYPVTFRQIQALSELLFRHRELYLAHPRIAVFNGGAKEGAARRLGNEFIKFGFDVVEIANLPDRREVPQSSFIRKNPAFPASHAETLRTLLAIEEGPQEATDGIPEGTADIVIVLGEDYTFEYLQDRISLKK